MNKYKKIKNLFNKKGDFIHNFDEYYISFVKCILQELNVINDMLCIERINIFLKDWEGLEKELFVRCLLFILYIFGDDIFIMHKNVNTPDIFLINKKYYELTKLNNQGHNYFKIIEINPIELELIGINGYSNITKSDIKLKNYFRPTVLDVVLLDFVGYITYYLLDSKKS